MDSQLFRPLSMIKNMILPKGKTIRTIHFGLYKNLKLNIDFTSQTQLYFGLWEKETHAHIKKLAKNINSAIDAGAGQGEQTLYFLARTAANKVFSFEPQESEHAEILSLLKANSIPSEKELILSNKYVGSETTSNSIRLDDLIPDLKLPCIIKVDIEGGEVSALRGATKLLQSSNVRWLIETHSLELEKSCVDIFKKNGYSVTIVYNAPWRIFIPEHRHLKTNRWLTAIKTA